jgi:hypothetical protein
MTGRSITNGSGQIGFRLLGNTWTNLHEAGSSFFRDTPTAKPTRPSMKQKFETKLLGKGPGNAWTFLAIPFDVQKAFGSKARVPVVGTINGFPFRNSLMPAGDGSHSMMVNKELQKGAKAAAGDTVAVVIELDKMPRSVTVPEDLKLILAKHKPAETAFAKLAYSHKKAFLDWIDSAKRPETRVKRLNETIDMLETGKRRE